MRFLLDMNISPAWVEALAAIGHEAVHWSSVGSPEAEDTGIAAHARANGMVVITNNLDFGRILLEGGLRLPSVIQLRLGNLRPATLLDTVRRTIEATQDDLAEGALVTIGSHRVRVAPLPLEGSEDGLS